MSDEAGPEVSFAALLDQGQSQATYRYQDSTDTDDIGDDQPLLAFSTHTGGSSSPLSAHDSDSIPTFPTAADLRRSSGGVSGRRVGFGVCVYLLLFLLLLLPTMLALLYPSFDLASLCASSDAEASSPNRFTQPLMQRGCEMVRDLWQSLHAAASAVRLAFAGGSSLPVVDPRRLALAHCLGYATKIPSSLSTATQTVRCPVAPALIVSTFFPDYLQLYPSVLSHTPHFDCERGTYLWVDWQYTDGMGNSLWAYSVVLSLAMSINATILALPFIATHIEYESHEERQKHFAFDEWEVHRSRWEQCAPESAVKRNQYTLPKTTSEYVASEPELHTVRNWMREVQTTQAAAANTTHLRASLTDRAEYRYMSADWTYQTISLPRVDNDGPGLTVHLKELGIDGPWSLGMFAPGIEVAKVNEIRWIAQQLHWRRHTHPVEEPATPATTSSTAVPTASPSEGSFTAPTAVWLTSDDIHVAIPVRRGDVSGNTAGGQLLISIDMRSRVMTDIAIAHLLNQTIAVIQSITANTSSTTLPSPTETIRSFHVANPPSPLSGREIVSRMIFTIYSEGPPDGFAVITDALLAAGIDLSRIRLRLNEKTSNTFTLLAQSDLILLAPSSFSYAAACYFNSEGIHIGSGWMFSRFVGCHNFIYAQWRRYIINHDEVKEGERFIPAEDISTPQWWGMDEEEAAELKRRVERLVARKERQRWSVEPIVLDNFREDYPRRWMYDHERPELMQELHAARVDRGDTTATPV